MQAHVTAVFVVGLILAGSALLPDSVRAQSNAAQPPAGSLESSPIGKVVTTSGSVTIEHASAVVVQANLPAASGVGQTKLGDLVYKGDGSRQEPMARSALLSPTAPHSIFRATPAWYWMSSCMTRTGSRIRPCSV